jgi:hypothetical protein
MRIRIDHMLAFNWKFLTPLAFVLLMLTAIVNAVFRGSSGLVYTAAMLLTNVAVGLVVVEVLRGYSRRQRARTSQPVGAAARP